jgi:hypothetical protein
VFLPKNLAALAGVAAKEATRYSANALRVLDPGDGTYRVEVTDGKRLAVVRGPCAHESGPAPNPSPLGLASVLVPVAEWKAAFRMGGKQWPVALSAQGSSFHLAVGEQSVTGSAPEGRFPDFASVLPKRPAPFAFCVDPLLMIGLLQAAAALEPTGGVGVLFYGPDKPVGLVARNDAGQFFDGLLMPLT